MMRLNIVSVALLGLATAAAQANPILTYKSQDWKDKCQDEPITDGWPSNNTVNLHPDVGTSSIWRSSMTDGAEAWHAGSGYRLPGADIDVHIHNTRTVPATLVDGLNDILFVSYNTEQFEDLGLSSRRARARIEAYEDADGVVHPPRAEVIFVIDKGASWDECYVDEVDLLINEDISFSHGLPDDLGLTRSAGSTVLHEIGHVLGLADRNDMPLSTMYNVQGSQFDIGRTLSPDEYEYAYLVDTFPDSSSGHNVAVSKFNLVPKDVESSDASDRQPPREIMVTSATIPVSPWPIWRGTTRSLSVGPFGFVEYADGSTSGTRGGPLRFQVLGTHDAEDVLTTWHLVMKDYLEPDATSCTPQAEGSIIPENASVLVEARLLTMGAGHAYVIARDISVPASTALGEYRLCVWIDSDDAITETDETDNVVIIDRLFKVEDPP